MWHSIKLQYSEFFIINMISTNIICSCNAIIIGLKTIIHYDMINDYITLWNIICGIINLLFIILFLIIHLSSGYNKKKFTKYVFKKSLGLLFIYNIFAVIFGMHYLNYYDHVYIPLSIISIIMIGMNIITNMIIGYSAVTFCIMRESRSYRNVDDDNTIINFYDSKKPKIYRHGLYD